MERINIAELLRDCPQGMELDCTCADNVVFDKIIEYEQIKCVIGECRDPLILDKYGRLLHVCCPKCVIFPKGKTTWKGFQRPFDDGLVISKEDRHDEIVMSGIYFDREYYADEVELHLGNYEIEVRDGKTYAIFKNQETKTDKLIEPIFKVGDRIKQIKTGNIYEITKIVPNYYIARYLGSDIMISFNDHDEYELVHVEPIFKVGDRIKHKDTVLTIITVQTNSYIVEDDPDNFGILVFSQQDKWELINEPKFKVGDTIKKKGLDISNPIKITAVNPKIYTFRNGSFQYVEIIDKDYELVSVKPKFKIGDRIRLKENHNYIYTITGISETENKYGCGVTFVLRFSEQDNWELVPNKFDVTTLKPFDKVLARCSTLERWRIQLFEKYDKTCKHPFICMGYNKYKQCIPYEGNEHLFDTTDECDEYFNLIS